MRRHSRRHSGRRSRIARIAWGLEAMLFCFTAENIWIDPWLRSMVVLLLGVEWCRVTNGLPGMLRRTHTVTLTWKASSSEVAGYAVYRSVTRGGNYVRINSSLVRELTYTDRSVDGGVTYFYVVRALDDRGNQSLNSNETSASIPFLW